MFYLFIDRVKPVDTSECIIFEDKIYNCTRYRIESSLSELREYNTHIERDMLNTHANNVYRYYYVSSVCLYGKHLICAVHANQKQRIP